MPIEKKSASARQPVGEQRRRRHLDHDAERRRLAQPAVGPRPPRGACARPASSESDVTIGSRIRRSPLRGGEAERRQLLLEELRVREAVAQPAQAEGRVLARRRRRSPSRRRGRRSARRPDAARPRRAASRRPPAAPRRRASAAAPAGRGTRSGRGPTPSAWKRSSAGISSGSSRLARTAMRTPSRVTAARAVRPRSRRLLLPVLPLPLEAPAEPLPRRVRLDDPAIAVHDDRAAPARRPRRGPGCRRRPEARRIGR